MAARNGKRGGDRILESRHLMGLFLGVVLLCAVFFTLGYVMGRSQYSGSVHAAATATTRGASPPGESSGRKEKATPAARPAGEWDFYTNKNSSHLDPSAPPLTSPSPSARTAPAEAGNSSVPPPPAAKAAGRTGAPKMLRGSIVLQVAAVTRSGDALAMAEALQQKKFPAFVVAPAADNFYRVQVGPYASDRAAESAKTALDHEGFKAIIKR